MFEKGVSGNPNGRPKGSKNKASEGLRVLITEFLERQFDQVLDDFGRLEPRERIKFYIELLQYSVPKLQAVSTSIDFEKLSDEDLDRVINELSGKHES